MTREMGGMTRRNRIANNIMLFPFILNRQKLYAAGVPTTRIIKVAAKPIIVLLSRAMVKSAFCSIDR